MNIIDTIKKLETSGFTRKQAETQVNMVSDFKKDLMTKEDAKQLEDRLDLKFDVIDLKFNALKEHVTTSIKYIPLVSALYTLGVFATVIGLIKTVPVFLTWINK